MLLLAWHSSRSASRASCSSVPALATDTGCPSVTALHHNSPASATNHVLRYETPEQVLRICAAASSRRTGDSRSWSRIADLAIIRVLSTGLPVDRLARRCSHWRTLRTEPPILHHRFPSFAWVLRQPGLRDATSRMHDADPLLGGPSHRRLLVNHQLPVGVSHVRATYERDVGLTAFTLRGYLVNDGGRAARKRKDLSILDSI